MRRRTVNSRCCCGARRAARRTPATCSTCTPGSWSERRSSARRRAAAVSRPCRSSRPKPMRVERQVISIFAGPSGYLDGVPVNRIRQFEEELLAYVTREHPKIQRDIVAKGKLDDELTADLRNVLTKFKSKLGYLIKA